MDKEDQLSFDFQEKLPVSTEEENISEQPVKGIDDRDFPRPTLAEETEEELAAEYTESAIDEANSGDTQAVEVESEKMPPKEDLATPKKINYESEKIPVPTQDEPKTVSDLLKPEQEIDATNFGDTQRVEMETDQLPSKEEFAPPQNVNYESADIPTPTPTAAAPPPTEKYKATKTDKNSLLKPHSMKRAILGWLVPQKPSGVGTSVPTRVSKYCADVAAFWSSPGKKRLMQPKKTVVVEIRRTREQCWPDCSRQEELLPLLVEQKELRSSLETEIRCTEPELKDMDNLFPEYESWRYSESKNRKYRRCLKQIERVEHALYKGSRFEQIRRAHVADFLYLAVPEGTVDPKELADGWGLINVKSDLSATVVKEAETWNCPIPNRLHLAQNIAASSRDSLFFSFGVRSGKNGKAIFSPIPKRRRNK